MVSIQGPLGLAGKPSDFATLSVHGERSADAKYLIGTLIGPSGYGVQGDFAIHFDRNSRRRGRTNAVQLVPPPYVIGYPSRKAVKRGSSAVGVLPRRKNDETGVHQRGARSGAAAVPESTGRTRG